MSPTVNPTWFMPALGDFPDISIPAPRSARRTTDHPIAAPLRLDRTSSSWLRNFLTTAGQRLLPAWSAPPRMSMVIIRMNIFTVNDKWRSRWGSWASA